MTDPTTDLNACCESPLPMRPIDVLLNLIVTLLTPIFLIESAGNIGFARLAAMETLKDYRAANQMELLMIAQIIGFSLTSLGSLALSMADDTEPMMILRWRNNANALARCADQNRRALDRGRSATWTNGMGSAQAGPAGADSAPTEEQVRYEAEVMAELAKTRRLLTERNAWVNAANAAAPAAEMQTEMQTGEPAEVPDQAAWHDAAAVASEAVVPPASNTIVAAASAPAGMSADDKSRSIWAAALSEVAAGFTADVAHLPPHAREAALNDIETLNSSATALLAGASLSELPLSADPPSGDLLPGAAQPSLPQPGFPQPGFPLAPSAGNKLKPLTSDGLAPLAGDEAVSG